MHEIAERCEVKLRKAFGGDAVCHTDPILKKTAEIEALETQFTGLVAQDSKIMGYHDFRVVAESENRIIVIADIDVAEDVHEAEFESIASALETRVKTAIKNVAYCAFYVTPKFAY
jgi:divalent metal cation (Fe/Co/Zn/Cd) transporter